MDKYIGVKIIEAGPMTAEVAGVTLQRPIDTSNADSEGNGYLVKYPDGYVSWSPKKQFDEAYRKTNGMTFGLAIEAMKQGFKVARSGWNGKGMFIVYQKGYPQGIPCNAQTAKAWGMTEGDLFKCEPYLQMKMATGSHFMYTPNTLDVLADDWEIVN